MNDAVFQLAFEGIWRDEVYRAAKDVFQTLFQGQEGENANIPLGVQFYQQIHIAVRPILAPGDGAEEKNRAHPVRRQFS